MSRNDWIVDVVERRETAGREILRPGAGEYDREGAYPQDGLSIRVMMSQSNRPSGLGTC